MKLQQILDPDTLFVKYFNTNTTDNATVQFTHNETITSSASNSPTAVVATCHIGSDCTSSTRCILHQCFSRSS